jgi:hypothetical protein
MPPSGLTTSSVHSSLLEHAKQGPQPRLSRLLVSARGAELPASAPATLGRSVGQGGGGEGEGAARSSVDSSEKKRSRDSDQPLAQELPGQRPVGLLGNIPVVPMVEHTLNEVLDCQAGRFLDLW